MRRLVLYIIGVITIGLIPCWLQYGCFMVTTDFLNQQIGFILETKKMLASGFPFWSWNTFFGQDFIASYSFYTVTSPFVWINCLCPVKYMMYSITFTLYLKLICIGLLSFLYFRKIQIKEQVAITGSLLFTFSSFVTISIGFYHFLEPIMCFPLLLWAIEKFIRGEKHSALILGLSTFAVGFANFYFVPCTLLSALIYLLCRLFSKDVNLSFNQIAIGVTSAVLGLAMSSFILLPTVLYMMGGERAQMGTIWNWTIADRIGSLFIPKVREGEIPLLSYTGWNSTAAYLAVLGVLPAAIYVWRKKNWLSAVIVALLVCYLTPLNGLFSLFTDVNYTRWAYALNFVLVTATVFFLNENMTIKRKQLLVFVFATLVVFVYRYFWLIWKPLRGYMLTSDEIGINAITLLCLLTGSAFLLIYCRNQQTKVLQRLIIIFSAIQLCCFCFLRSDAYCNTFDGDKNKKNLYAMYVKNNSYPYQLQWNTYRTDFITRTQPYYYANVCLLKNAPSVSSYNSVRSNKLTKLCLTIDKAQQKKPSGILKDYNQQSFDCLMSVRDVVQYKDSYSTTTNEIAGTLENETDDYMLYQAKYYIPFGFAYDSFVMQEEIDSLIYTKSSVDIPLMMLDNIAVKSEDVSELSKHLSKSTINRKAPLDSIYIERKQVTGYDTEWTTKGFNCKVNIPKEPQLIFFSIPAEKGFNATIDGESTKIYEVNCGLSAVLVTEGLHSIVFEYTPQGFYIGLIIALISFLLLLLINYYNCRRMQENQNRYEIAKAN